MFNNTRNAKMLYIALAKKNHFLNISLKFHKAQDNTYLKTAFSACLEKFDQSLYLLIISTQLVKI